MARLDPDPVTPTARRVAAAILPAAMLLAFVLTVIGLT